MSSKVSMMSMTSKVSNSSSPEKKAQKEMERLLRKLPEFLSQERDHLLTECEKLGYQRPHINRAFRDGVPAASLEVLVDSMINGGYGRLPTYKDLAEEAVKEPAEANVGRGRDKLPELLESFLTTEPESPSSWRCQLDDLEEDDFNFGTTALAAIPPPGSAFNLGTTVKPPGPDATSDPFMLGLERPDSRGDSIVGRSASRLSSEDIESGFRSRPGTHSRPGTKDKSSKVGWEEDRKRSGSKLARGASGGLRTDSKLSSGSPPPMGILKGAGGSRPTSKDLAPVGRWAGTKESMGSESSLRGAANVRFSDVSLPQPKCGICLVADANTIFGPCGHQIACADCADEYRKEAQTCPYCQSVIQEVRRL